MRIADNIDLPYPDIDVPAVRREVIAILAEARPELLCHVEGRWTGPLVSSPIPCPIWTSRGGIKVLVSGAEAADGSRWLHVSFSRADRMPDYADMCEIRARFFRPTDSVVHVWPPVDEHVNDHETCLHLWTRIDGVRTIVDLRAVDASGRAGV